MKWACVFLFISSIDCASAPPRAGSKFVTVGVTVSLLCKSVYPLVKVVKSPATTFDVINISGNYIGGLITPGINLSLYNLFKKTSMLPLIKFKRKNSLIGKDTKNAIENGIYWSYIGLVTFIIKKIQNKFKKNFFCISTGGLSKIISKDINLINIVNENLTIHGLIEIFKLNYYEKSNS